MRRPERRSAALARAQAHLAGRRVAAKGAQQQQEDWGPGRRLPTAGPSSSSSSISSSSSRPHGPHGPPSFRLASGLSDASSSSSSAPPGGEKPAEGLNLGESPPRPRPHSRFLKQRPQKGGPLDGRTAGLDPATGAGRGATPAARPSALLRRLAQVEDMIRSRKPRRGGAQTVPVPDDDDDDEISVSDSIRDTEHRAEGLKYLKRSARPQQEVGARDPPPRKGAGGEERRGGGASVKPRERRGLSGLTLGGKVTSPSRPRPSLPAQSSLKTPPHRSPSPPESSSALPPRDPSPPTSSRSLSPPERSLIRSLDELFSEAAGTPREASGSSSSSNFRVNVFSLEDLAPSAASQKEGLEAKATMAPVAGKSVKVLGAAPAPAVVAQSPFAAPTKVSVEEAATQEEEDLGETEISERLSCSSARLSACEEESPGSAEYSEDFEPAASSAESEATRPPSSPECSSPSEASSLGSTKPLRRVTMTDAAVQTNGSSLAYHWWQTGVPVTLGQVEGGSAIEGAPVASHVLSLDVVEALTTYSPAAFALNSLLEQNVLLIRQFVEASRRLHASFVASLEEENFHYHSLEEAKRGRELHKSRAVSSCKRGPFPHTAPATPTAAPSPAGRGRLALRLNQLLCPSAVH